MAQVRESWDLDHPLEDVWSLLIDPDRWMEWNTGLSDMRDVRGPFDHVGAGYTQVWRVVGMEREGSWWVTGCAPRRWRTIEADTPLGARLHVRDGFERVGAGCRVTIEVVLDAPHGLLGRALDGLLAEPLLRRAVRGNRERVRRALGGDA